MEPSAANAYIGYNRGNYANCHQYAFSGSQFYQVHTEKHTVRHANVHMHKLTFTRSEHLIHVTHTHH